MEFYVINEDIYKQDEGDVISNKTWYHVAFIYDTDGRVTNIYLDDTKIYAFYGTT